MADDYYGWYMKNKLGNILSILKHMKRHISLFLSLPHKLIVFKMLTYDVYLNRKSLLETFKIQWILFLNVHNILLLLSYLGFLSCFKFLIVGFLIFQYTIKKLSHPYSLFLRKLRDYCYPYFVNYALKYGRIWPTFILIHILDSF